MRRSRSRQAILRTVQFGKRVRLHASTYRDPGVRFHIVIQSHPEIERFDRAVADAIWTTLMEMSRRGVEVHAAVLMPAHLHLVLEPRSTGVVEWVGAFKSKSARATWPFGVSRTPWQPRFFDRALRAGGEYDAALAYVLRNPS